MYNIYIWKYTTFIIFAIIVNITNYKLGILLLILNLISFVINHK